jgi:hypothetical protein
MHPYPLFKFLLAEYQPLKYQYKRYLTQWTGKPTRRPSQDWSLFFPQTTLGICRFVSNPQLWRSETQPTVSGIGNLAAAVLHLASVAHRKSSLCIFRLLPNRATRILAELSFCF